MRANSAITGHLVNKNDKEKFKKLQKYNIFQTTLRKEEAENLFQEHMGRPPRENEQTYVQMLSKMVAPGQNHNAGQDQHNEHSDEDRKSKVHVFSTGYFKHAQTEDAPSTSKPVATLIKENSILRKENDRLHMDIAGRPQTKEWKVLQRKVKDLEQELMALYKMGGSAGIGV